MIRHVDGVEAVASWEPTTGLWWRETVPVSAWHPFKCQDLGLAAKASVACPHMTRAPFWRLGQRNRYRMDVPEQVLTQLAEQLP